MAGLNAARLLREADWRVTVLDKGRTVGGRLATRRIDNGVYDHGAQFITVRSPQFSKLAAALLHDGVLYEWCRGIGTPDHPSVNDGHPRYQGTGGMNVIAKHLARDLDVRIRHRVVRIRPAGKGWTAVLESGQEFSAECLVVTTPVPQALDLLDLGGTELPGANRSELDQLKYYSCIALLASLDRPTLLPSPGALRIETGPISFICDNRMKGISEITTVTIHASPAFSREHWSVPDKQITEYLLGLAKDWLPGTVRTPLLHRWKFSQPVEPYPDTFMRIDGHAPLLFAGDAFNGPRVEGAVLSGMAAAESLLAS